MTVPIPGSAVGCQGRVAEFPGQAAGLGQERGGDLIGGEGRGVGRAGWRAVAGGGVRAAVAGAGGFDAEEGEEAAGAGAVGEVFAADAHGGVRVRFLELGERGGGCCPAGGQGGGGAGGVGGGERRVLGAGQSPRAGPDGVLDEAGAGAVQAQDSCLRVELEEGFRGAGRGGGELAPAPPAVPREDRGDDGCRHRPDGAGRERGHPRARAAVHGAPGGRGLLAEREHTGARGACQAWMPGEQRPQQPGAPVLVRQHDHRRPGGAAGLAGGSRGGGRRAARELRGWQDSGHYPAAAGTGASMAWPRPRTGGTHELNPSSPASIATLVSASNGPSSPAEQYRRSQRRIATCRLRRPDSTASQVSGEPRMFHPASPGPAWRSPAAVTVRASRSTIQPDSPPPVPGVRATTRNVPAASGSQRPANRSTACSSPARRRSASPRCAAAPPPGVAALPATVVSLPAAGPGSAAWLIVSGRRGAGGMPAAPPSSSAGRYPSLPKSPLIASVTGGGMSPAGIDSPLPTESAVISDVAQIL